MHTLLKPPVFEDENKNHIAFMLHVILWTLILLAVPYLVFSLILTPETAREDITMTTAGTTVNIFLFYLLRRGHIRLASILQVTLFWLLINGIALTLDGIHGPAYLIGNILVITLAGALLGGRGILVITIMSILSGLGIYFIEVSGWLIFDYNPPLVGFLVVSAVFFPIIAVLQYLASRTMQQALSRAATSEKKYRTILDSIQDVFYRVDRSGCLTMISPSGVKSLGYTKPEEVCGRNMAEFWAQPAQRELMVQELLLHDELYNWEMEIKRRDNSCITISTSIHQLLDNMGEFDGYEGIWRDITDRKLAEVIRENLIVELEAKNTEMERFTYTVSHDIKAPLITIRGFLGLIEREIQRGNYTQIQDYMLRINSATDKMQRLLSELLELSRVGRLVNPPQNISFEVVAHDAIHLLDGSISERGVQVNLAPNLPTVLGDHTRLVEVIQNLLDNAIKFMGTQPKPRIEIGQQGLDSQGKPVFFVRDNGKGIDLRHHGKIFDLFNKLDPESEGTGIGLTLVKRIIEVHGGRIWVESQLGEGTTFFFTLNTH